MIRQLLIEFRKAFAKMADKGYLSAIDLRDRLDTALTEQCTAADEMPFAYFNRETGALRFVSISKMAKAGNLPDAETPVYLHPPHPQVNEPPSSLTSGQGKERIEQQKVEIDRLKEVLHDEIAANLVVREKGGAHDDEDMPTFLERLIAERDEFRARAQMPVTKDIVTDEMVRRFLSWRLPKDFHPDAGISFDRSFSDKYPHCWPIGTNLFNDPQVRAMLEHVLAVADQLAGGGK